MAGDTLNTVGVSYARTLIRDGAVDKTSAWTFSAADGDELLGPDGKDWSRYGQCHLAKDPAAAEQTKAYWAFPFAKLKGGKVVLYRAALTAIRQRAAAQSATAIYEAAGRLLRDLDGGAEASAANGPTTIRANAFPVEIEAASAADKRPTFAMVGYTGAPMRIEGFYNPVIVDLAGLKYPSQQIPAYRGHDPDKLVGQTDTITVGKTLVLTGTITGDNEDAQEIVTQAKNGFKWQASIGADIVRREFLDAGKTATVNGREVTGPLLISRETMLGDMSFVPRGADTATSATVAASSSLGPSSTGDLTMFEQWLAAKGIDPAALTDATKSTLRAAYDAEQALKASAATAAAAAAAAAGTTPATGATDTVEAIIAEQRREDERIVEITKLTRQAIAKYPRMVDTIDRLAQAACASRTKTPRDYELDLLRVRPEVHHPSINARPALADIASNEVIEAAIASSLQLANIEKSYKPEVLDVVSARFPRGIGLREMFKLVAAANGYTQLSDHDHGGILRAAFNAERRQDIRAESGFSTVEISGILSNLMNKFLIVAFNAVENSWQLIASVRPVKDFKLNSSYALVGDTQYEKVGAGGEIKHAAAGETTYTVQADSYAKMMALTRKDIINDDLGALAQVPKRLGRGAALKINDIFWTVFLSNPTVNGNAFFSSGNKNVLTGAGSALSISALTSALALFRKQVDPDGKPLGITPKFLLTPPEIEITADQLMHSTLVVSNIASTGTAGTSQVLPGSNVFMNKFTPVTSVYLSNSSYTNNSATAWYLMASPEDLSTIEICFLNGRQTPIIESAEADFDVLGVRVRGFHDFGVNIQEFRAANRSAGA